MLVIEKILNHAYEIKVELLMCLVALIILKYFLSLQGKRPNIPGPFPWPVIGNAASLGSKPHISMQAMAKKYGPVYLMKLGNEDVLVLNDYPSIKEALGKQKLVFEGRPIFKSFEKISQGKGIVFNSPLNQGKKWRELKAIVIRHLHKFMTSSETRNLLSDHICKESVELIRNIDKLGKESSDGITEPESILNVSIANIACALIFGHRYDYENKEFQDLVSMNQQFGNVVGAGSQVDVMPWIKIFPSFRKALKTFDFLNDRFNEWMKNRTSEHRNTYVNGVTRDIVDTFISEGIAKPNSLLKDDIIMALTTDVFGAAQDTLSTSLQWMLIYMMYFPDIQEKVHQELDSVIGEDRLPEITDLKFFPYTTAVMHEIFRHSTFSSTTIPHMTTSDTKLGHFFIPKGLLLFVNQYAANHDPEYWDSPDEFRPERFLDKNGKVIPNAHDRYLLFSYGSRKCPGDNLARTLLVHITANLFSLGHFESDPKNPTTLEAIYCLSSRPKLLQTKMRIRKPELFKQLVQQLPNFSPYVSTIDSVSSSFTTFSDEEQRSENEPKIFNKNRPFQDGIIRIKEQCEKMECRNLSSRF